MKDKELLIKLRETQQIADEWSRHNQAAIELLEDANHAVMEMLEIVDWLIDEIAEEAVA